MDPLTLSTSFAAIVGLMSNFSSERGHQDVLEIKDFVEWLRDHGHNEVLSAIEKSAQVSVSIKAILAEGHKELAARLGAIDASLAVLSANQGPFSSLAMSLSPRDALSAQAREILVAYESQQSANARIFSAFGERSLGFVDVPASEGYDPSDPRFLDDDLEQLVRLGLCMRSVRRGETHYLLTRQGALVAQSILKAGS